VTATTAVIDEALAMRDATRAAADAMEQTL
jgi:hypothetical protein